MQQVQGKFSVKATPQDLDAVSKELGLMRMKFDKQFEGALSATGTVSMMGILNRELNSGGYVAVERIVGKLGDKSGSFYLQHSSTIHRGSPVQSITVIPDSGTGELTGITGHMVIDIVESQHFYSFHYAL